MHEVSIFTLEPASLIELPKPHAGAVCSDAKHCVPNVLRKLLAFHASFPLYCERLMRSATAMAPSRCFQLSTEVTDQLQRRDGTPAAAIRYGE